MDQGTPAQTVGNQFITQYYTVLHSSPKHLHRFYSDRSVLTHADVSLEGTSVVQNLKTATGQKMIHETVKSLGFEDAMTEIYSVDSQYSKDGGVVVQVTGTLQVKGKDKRLFVQTFFLAVQEKGYYVLNDIFRYLLSPALVHSAVEEEEEGEGDQSTASNDGSGSGQHRDPQTTKHPSLRLSPSANFDSSTTTNANANGGDLLESIPSFGTISMHEMNDLNDDVVEPGRQSSDHHTSNTIGNGSRSPAHVVVTTTAALTSPPSTDSLPKEHNEAPRPAHLLSSSAHGTGQGDAESSEGTTVVFGELNASSSRSTPPATCPQNAEEEDDTNQIHGEMKSETDVQTTKVETSESETTSKTNNINENNVAFTSHYSNARSSHASSALSIDPAPTEGVFIRDIPPAVTFQQLAEALSEFGPISPGTLSLKVQRDRNSYAFVDFQSIESAAACIEKGLEFFGKKVTAEAKRPIIFRQNMGNVAGPHAAMYAAAAQPYQYPAHGATHVQYMGAPGIVMNVNTRGGGGTAAAAIGGHYHHLQHHIAQQQQQHQQQGGGMSGSNSNRSLPGGGMYQQQQQQQRGNPSTPPRGSVGAPTPNPVIMVPTAAGIAAHNVQGYGGHPFVSHHHAGYPTAGMMMFPAGAMMPSMGMSVIVDAYGNPITTAAQPTGTMMSRGANGNGMRGGSMSGGQQRSNNPGGSLLTHGGQQRLRTAPSSPAPKSSNPDVSAE